MKRILLICLLLAAPASARDGLVVYLGCGDGMDAEAGHVVHGLDTDEATVDASRKKLVQCSVFDGEHLPYAENLVNRLIVNSRFEVTDPEIMRVLAPGGVAIVDGKKIVKPVPADTDEWTHWLHGPDGNAVARDSRVGPPRRLQWMAGPRWARLHDAPSSTMSMVSSGGRVFYINDEGFAGMYEGLADKWVLVARDAYNGILLWKLPLPDWGWQKWTAKWHARNNLPFQMPKRLVAVGDTVYVTLGFNSAVSAIDATNGQLIKTYAGTEGTDEILYLDGKLVLSINQAGYTPSMEPQEPVRKSIAVVDTKSGRSLWKKGDFTGLPAKTGSIAPDGRLELAAGDGQVFLCDHDSTICLDLDTGDEAWRVPRVFGPKLNANFNTRMYELSVLVYNDGVVLLAQPEGMTSFHSVPGTLYAYDANDGKLLWKHRYGGWVHNTQPNVFVVDGTVWIHEHQEGETLQGKRAVLPKELHEKADYAVLGLDLRTGDQEKRISTKDILNVGHHHRCYRNKATERFLLMSRRGVEFVNTTTGENDLNHWARGDCHAGIMPCNGLLYTTPHPCSCYIDSKLNGFYALAPAGDSLPPSTQLIEGPAFGATDFDGSSTAGQWPTFRADAKRAGSVRTDVSAKPVPGWTADLGAECGPLTIADGKVFAPVIEQHRVVALNAGTGKEVWRFVAGGRVDTPPTIFNGMALFGAADGWVYCLRAADGALVWKRRIAPRERLVGVIDGLESAWPVHGSVLVEDGVAYMAAGRSSFLDGGIHLFALQPETGKIIGQRTEYTPDPVTHKMAADPAFSHDMPGMLSDILVSDGESVWMRNNKVFGEMAAIQPPLYSTAGFRDDSWFNRTTWTIGSVGHAQLLVFEDTDAYAIESFSSVSRAAPFAAGGKGYRLFAKDLHAKGQRQPSKKGKKTKTRVQDKWSAHIPLRGTAMVLAGDVLFVAGSPDTVDPEDPLAALEGRRGALLNAYASATGEKLSEHQLDALPVWDGLAAANGRLYLATKDGKVRCFD